MPVGRRGSLLPAVLNNGQTTRSATAERVTDLRRTTPATTGVCVGECGWGVAVVLAAFIVHCIVDGVGYSFAVFYVDLLDEFTAQNHAKVVLVGTLLPATCLFVGPLVGALTNKLGCRLVTVCGSVLAAVGVGASSFCSHINMLIATYGLLAGLGFGMMHLPSIIIVSFYFTRRRALVTAIVLCGSGVGKFLFAPLTRYLMDRYGWRGANCILAAIILHGAACGCAFRPLRACSAARPPPSRRPAGCVMMQKTVDETRRRRRDSTCSLDGRVITSDGRLLAAHDDDRTTASRQPSSRLQSAGRPRTLSDSASTDPSWLVRPCSQPGRQLPTGHRCGFVDGRLSGGSSSDARRSRTRTVSEPVSLSPGASLRHSAVCTGDQCRLTLDGPVDLLSSATVPRTASAEVLETSDRVMTSVPDVETVERRSSQTSSINPHCKKSVT